MPCHSLLLLYPRKYDGEFTVEIVTHSANAVMGKIAIKIRSTQSRENMRLCICVVAVMITTSFFSAAHLRQLS